MAISLQELKNKEGIKELQHVLHGFSAFRFFQ
jgi:hypothetical protein